MAIYPCLATAGTLNLVDKAMINKPKLLNQMLEATRINVWVSTPSFMEMCLMLPNLSENQYDSLKEFFFCGEILPHRTAKRYYSDSHLRIFTIHTGLLKQRLQLQAYGLLKIS